MKKPANFLIKIIDDVGPEANAMLQALYSRDPRSVEDHLKKVAEVGSDKFMASYYVGYGHKSIGDCGTTTIYVEQVSMLAAKAIQDWALYNGQEASTRYLDMSTQAVLNPVEGTPDEKLGAEIQAEWMTFYKEALATLVPFLKERFPRKEGDSENVYNKAINAKAFDIARGFLPAGITTLLSWHTNLRQAYDHLQLMAHHPAEEIRDIAASIHAQLKDKYKNSFSHKQYEEQEKYLAKAALAVTYFDDASIKDFGANSSLDLKGLSRFQDLLGTRPVKTELPHQLRKFGTITFSFPLDFGSFRDLQRHRSGVMMMPLLSTKYAFYPWYLEQLPADLKKKAQAVLAAQEKRIASLKCDDVTRQYYVAMGYTITCEVTLALPAAIYLAELRSAQTVHPTLRVIAQQMGDALAEAVPGIVLHYDKTPDVWDVKRGTQDITKKA